MVAGGPAEAADVRVGTRIAAIDGTAAEKLSLPAVRERFRNEPAGTAVKLTLLAGGSDGKSSSSCATSCPAHREGKSTTLARMKSAFVFGLLLAAGMEAADVPEPGSRDAIAAATTDKRFLSPWVADVPDSPTVPSPTKFLGHVVGAPGELTRTERIYAYFRALAAATPRVQRRDDRDDARRGARSSSSIVGDEKNLARLGALKADDGRPCRPAADGRGCDGADRGRDASPFYMLHGGLHSIGDRAAPRCSWSSRTGSPSRTPRTFVRSARSSSFSSTPCAEPDGRDREVDWFYRVPEGEDRLRRAAAPLAALLGRLRLPRQQPRRHPAEAGPDARHAGRLPRVASRRRARPARVDSAPDDLDRNRPVQRERRSHHGGRDPGLRDERGDVADRVRNARGLDVGLHGGLVAVLRRLRRRRTTTPSAAGTRRSATRPPRPSSGGSTPSGTSSPASPSPRPSGTARCRRRRSRSGGRSATTRTTWRPGVLVALQYAARNGAGSAPELLAAGTERGRKGWAEAPYAVVLPEAQDDKRAARRSRQPPARARNRGGRARRRRSP